MSRISQNIYFYENIIEKLIPIVVEMQANGIPINVEKAKQLLEDMEHIEEKATESINSNPLIIKYMESKGIQLVVEEKEEKDFLTEFNPHNAIHISYFINAWLDENGYENFKLSSWNKEDIDKLQSIINSEEINDVINSKDNSQTGNFKVRNVIEKARLNMASDKKNLYDKNNNIQRNNKRGFNIGSHQQRQGFLRFNGIDTAKTDRETLERILKELSYDTISA